ncbi:hypothetical protein [Rubrobacter indicoceani]|uniref:hypothetical protein n=1 Tax=Rubrobacter indicoceani TaxID=2051957 RepID=UPI000E5A1F43|nr:hypothetical protein [Rubrobacter indicoceani]
MQKESVLADWTGYGVFVTYTSGPDLDANEPNKLVRGEAQAVTASFLLERVGEAGIEVKRGDSPTIFMSWGAIMYIQGPPPEVRAQIDRQTSNKGTDASMN